MANVHENSKKNILSQWSLSDFDEFLSLFLPSMDFEQLNYIFDASSNDRKPKLPVIMACANKIYVALFSLVVHMYKLFRCFGVRTGTKASFILLDVIFSLSHCCLYLSYSNFALASRPLVKCEFFQQNLLHKYHLNPHKILTKLILNVLYVLPRCFN